MTARQIKIAFVCGELLLAAGAAVRGVAALARGDSFGAAVNVVAAGACVYWALDIARRG